MQVYDNETKHNVRAKPNQDTFRHVMYACSKSRAKNAPEMAKDILVTMIEWNVQGKLKYKPITTINITAMDACAINVDVDGTFQFYERWKGM